MLLKQVKIVYLLETILSQHSRYSKQLCINWSELLSVEMSDSGGGVHFVGHDCFLHCEILLIWTQRGEGTPL